MDKIVKIVPMRHGEGRVPSTYVVCRRMSEDLCIPMSTGDMGYFFSKNHCLSLFIRACRHTACRQVYFFRNFAVMNSIFLKKKYPCRHGGCRQGPDEQYCLKKNIPVGMGMPTGSFNRPVGIPHADRYPVVLPHGDRALFL